MNKLKEMNGRYYQECEVVMLDTDKKAPFYLDKVIGLSKAPQDRTIEGLEYQHLYFLSNEEIKKDDWYCDISMKTSNYGIHQCDSKRLEAICNQFKVQVKKIIATTDTSLGLPQPSKEFIQAYIKAYNEGKPITKVLVEYKKCYNQPVDENYEKFGDLWVSVELKVNSSNEITIKKIKDSYTREELRPIFLKLCHDTADYIEKGYDEKTEFNIDNWLEQNL